MAHDVFADRQLLDDLRSDRPRVEIIGNSRVVVENHKGILEYDDTLLRVKCSGCEVRITGDELALAALTLDELAVTGTIVSVEYRTGG
ncbi:YabP/YqfC family sporulation protein [Agathobaculum sp.]|uniref:YabP/YqfC family sporulation protein n=1 Tax=Agathobaculum sp. TaxID=2048138 RepID=UPI002A7F354C|nr:YabP/YqfC family sporulation protein [Agathobaculum sp.]MDY3617524.1 YabP/YqfC family sporulation protein [Agathobaculum sp.]